MGYITRNGQRVYVPDGYMGSTSSAPPSQGGGWYSPSMASGNPAGAWAAGYSSYPQAYNMTPPSPIPGGWNPYSNAGYAAGYGGGSTTPTPSGGASWPSYDFMGSFGTPTPKGPTPSGWSGAQASYQPSAAYGSFGSFYGTGNGGVGINAGLGQLMPGQNTSSMNAGDRRIGSVNYNAVANLMNYANSSPQAAAYLKSQGLMPSYSFIGPSKTGSVGGGSMLGGYNPYMGKIGANGQGMGLLSEYGYQHPIGASSGPSGFQSAMGGGAPGSRLPYTSGGGLRFGGAMAGGAGSALGGSVPRTGLPLEGAAEGGYMDLIRNRGSYLSPSQEAGLVNRSTDAINRGTEDAIQSAKVAAARRGDFSGQSISDQEGKLRMAGAAASNEAGENTQTALRRESVQNLLAALGGGNSMFGTQLGNLDSLRKYQVLLAQAQAQNGMGGLNTVLNLS